MKTPVNHDPEKYEPVQKTVSILMPVRNEGEFIRKSLQTVIDQDYPSEHLEILVIDGMSDDNTRQIVNEIAAQHRHIRLIDNPGRIVPTGLNIGLQQARGEIIIRVDGHCEIQPDYVRRCVQYLTRENVDGVGGPIDTIGETHAAQAIAISMSSPFGVGGSAFRTIKDRRMDVDTVAFPAYRRETIQKAGLFDEELVRNQDDEYNFRLREMGGRILLAPDIRSRYYSRSSFSSLWRQYFQYGYWKVRVMQKHPRQMSLRQFVPPTFVATILALAILALFLPVARLLLAVTTGAYILANLFASAWTAYRRGWQYLIYLPLAYAILHISYGSGFLYGLVRFRKRWKPETRNG